MSELSLSDLQLLAVNAEDAAELRIIVRAAYLRGMADGMTIGLDAVREPGPSLELPALLRPQI